MYQTVRSGQKRTKDLLNDQSTVSAVGNPRCLTSTSDFVIPRFDANTLHASLHAPYPEVNLTNRLDRKRRSNVITSQY